MKVKKEKEEEGGRRGGKEGKKNEWKEKGRKEARKNGREGEKRKQADKWNGNIYLFVLKKIPLPYCILIVPCVKCVIQIMFLLSN